MASELNAVFSSRVVSSKKQDFFRTSWIKLSSYWSYHVISGIMFCPVCLIFSSSSVYTPALSLFSSDSTAAILKIYSVPVPRLQKIPSHPGFASVTSWDTTRLRVSSGIVGRAKRERAWKSPHARKGDTRRGERKMRSFFSLPAACRLFSRGVIFKRARVSLALLSLRKNGGLLVV